MRTPSRYLHDVFRGILDRIAASRNDAASGAPSEPDLPATQTPSVDVVVCVYNALPDVRRCVASVLRCLDSRTRLVVVNDASDEETSAYLRSLTARRPSDVHLIEHAVNRGYTEAANTGLRASTADYVILLNSDTVVTPGWVERIVACGESDPRIGVVGPLSNAASWQTVPRLLADDGTFHINELPVGHSAESFAALVASVSQRVYPRVPLVNGFCFAIKRAVIDRVGEFDAVAFPRGYGEENDYCLRVRGAGFALAVADDAYVFHAKSKSFGHADRVSLSREGKRAFEHKHGKDVVAPLVKQVRDSKELAAIRDRVAAASAEQPADRILFVLPGGSGGGGAHSVVQEVAAMRRRGVDARVAVKHRHLDRFLTTYRAVPECADIFVPYVGDDLLDIAGDCSIVVATAFSSVAALRRIVLAHPAVLPAYYVQDYEPLFFEPDSPDHREAFASYSLIPGAVLFAKTTWIADTVRERHGVEVHKVAPSLDHDVYSPAPRSQDDSVIRICAMIRPATPRRGAPRTMRVLGAVQERYGSRVSLHIFGCEDDDPDYLEIADLAPCENHGVLDREGVAKVLQASDVFVDLSDYQAFGRTGLEAMACGCAVVNPHRGGTSEYSTDGVNCLLVDTTDESACVEALCRLIEDGDLRRRLGSAGLETAAAYTPARAAESELRVLRSAAARVRENPAERPIHVRALVDTEEGPYSDPSLARHVLFEPTTVKELLEAQPPCDVVLIQSDAAIDVPTARALIDGCRNRGIRVVYEVDEVLLDPAGSEPAADLARLSRHVARRADAVLVSSQRVADAYRDSNDRVIVVPDVDADLRRLEVLQSLWDHPSQRASGFARPGGSSPTSAPRTTAPLTPATGYHLLKRRAQKLARDPRKFLADSRFGVVRRLGRRGRFS